MYELRQAEPGNVLVPLAVGNTWRYSGSGSSVVYRVTGPNPEGEGVLVERVHRGRGRETRTVETWSAGTAVGDGSFYARTADGRSSGFGYTFGTANTEGEGVRLEYEPFAIGDENRYGVCYVVEQTDLNASFVRPGRTCFLSGIGIVSDDRDGWMTLTSYTLR